MLHNGIRFVVFALALCAAAEEKHNVMPDVRGLMLGMPLDEVKTVMARKGYRLGPDEWSAMRTMSPFMADPRGRVKVKAVQSYEIYVPGETLEVERTPGLFEPVDELNAIPRRQQVTMKDAQGYVLVDKQDKVVGLSFAFAFFDAKGEALENVVHALEKRWNVRFARRVQLLNDGREDVNYTYVDIKNGFEVTFSDLMFDRFVDIVKIRGEQHPVNLD